MSTPRHRIIALVLAVVGSVTLSGCIGTNFSAQTDQQYQPSVGANVRDGDLQIYNALFVENEDGTATLSAGLLADNADEEITSVEVVGHEAELAGPISLDQDALFTVGAEGEIIVTLGDTKPGAYLSLKLVAASGATVSVNAPVVIRTDMYDSVATSASGAEAAAADDADEAATVD